MQEFLSAVSDTITGENIMIPVVYAHFAKGYQKKAI